MDAEQPPAPAPALRQQMDASVESGRFHRGHKSFTASERLSFQTANSLGIASDSEEESSLGSFCELTCVGSDQEKQPAEEEEEKKEEDEEEEKMEEEEEWAFSELISPLTVTVACEDRRSGAASLCLDGEEDQKSGATSPCLGVEEDQKSAATSPCLGVEEDQKSAATSPCLGVEEDQKSAATSPCLGVEDQKSGATSLCLAVEDQKSGATSPCLGAEEVAAASKPTCCGFEVAASSEASCSSGRSGGGGSCCSSARREPAPREGCRSVRSRWISQRRAGPGGNPLVTSWEYPLSAKEKHVRVALIYEKEAGLMEAELVKGGHLATELCSEADVLLAENRRLRRRLNVLRAQVRCHGAALQRIGGRASRGHRQRGRAGLQGKHGQLGVA